MPVQKTVMRLTDASTEVVTENISSWYEKITCASTENLVFQYDLHTGNPLTCVLIASIIKNEFSLQVLVQKKFLFSVDHVDKTVFFWVTSTKHIFQ